MNRSTPAPLGPFPVADAQYSLVYNLRFQTWELHTVAGVTLGSFVRVYLHENALGQRIYGWRDTAAHRLWGTDPRTAVTRFVLARQTPQVAA